MTPPHAAQEGGLIALHGAKPFDGGGGATFTMRNLNDTFATTMAYKLSFVVM